MSRPARPHSGAPRPPSRRHSLPARRASRLPVLLAIAAAVFVLDRLSKHWALAHLPFSGGRTIVPGILHIHRFTNNGAAFSLFANSASPHLVSRILVAVMCIVSAFVFSALVALRHRIGMLTIALALVLGGALGNIYDRIAYGAVVDFLDLQLFGLHYHFNLADTSVVSGVCLLLLDSLPPRRSYTPRP